MAFLWPSRIRFVDTDASGWIHYTALFRHLECAEIEFFRSIGLTYPQAFDRGLSIPRVHVEADYLLRLHHDDEIMIEVRVEKIGETSATLVFDVRKQEGGATAARGRYVFVCIEIATLRPIAWPAELRAALERFQAV